MADVTSENVVYDRIVPNQKMITVLRETSKWTKFISIVGFIMIGIMLMGVLSMGALSSGFGAMGVKPSIFIIGFYCLILLVELIPLVYLYQFSSYLKKALNTNSSITLMKAFINLKSFFKFVGIMLAIGLIFNVLAVMGMIGGMAFTKFLQ